MTHRVAQVIVTGVVALGLGVPLSAQDTGRVALERRDSAAYPTPELCDRAVAAALRAPARAAMADTMPYVPSADTIPTDVARLARGCSVAFSAAAAAPRSLWSVMRLALVAGRDAEAERAAERIVGGGETPEGRAGAMQAVIATYLRAAPTRWPAARTWFARLSAMQPAAAARGAVYASHVLMMGYWQALYVPDSILAHANAAIALRQAMPPAEWETIDVTSPSYALADLANDRSDLAAQRAILERATREVGAVRGGRVSAEFARAQRLIDARAATYGKTARALRGAYLFNAGTTAHPAPGRVSMLVRVDHTCREGSCLTLVALARALGTRYGAALDITLLDDLRGFTPNRGLVPVDTEATLAARYFLDEWRFPATVLIDARPWTRRADGKVVYQPTPLSGMFDGWELANVVVIDPTGAIRWVALVESRLQERELWAVIDRLNRSPASGIRSAAP